MRYGLMVLLPVLGLAAPAAAQTPTPLAYWQFSVGEVLEPLAGPPPDWRVELGGGFLTQPKFPGARRYELLPDIDVDVRYRDIAFASIGEGVGVNLLHGTTYRAGVAVAYDIGRNHADDPRLSRLHNVDPAPEGKVFAEAFFEPVVVSVALRQAVGGHGGLIGDVGAYVPIPLSDSFFLFAGPAVTIANASYMRSYFGVSAREAAGTPLRAFTPDGGVKSVTFGLSATYEVDDHWTLVSNAAWERFVGDAAASPIIETKDQLTIGFDAVYRF